MATQPTGDVDARLAGLDDSLRKLCDKIDTLRRSVADLDPSSAPAPQPPPAPPSPPAPQAGPPPVPPATDPLAHGAAPGAPGEGDDLVGRLRGLLDELKGITPGPGSAASGAGPAGPATSGAPAPAPAPGAPSPTPPPPVTPEPPAPQGPPPAAAPPIPTPEPPDPHAPQGPPPPSEPVANVAVIDAGPFADLIALRSFEESLMSLPGIQDLRVRRFRQERAEIQLLLAGAVPVERELARLGHGIEIQPGTEGVMRVELPRQAGPQPAHGRAGDEPPAEGP